MAAPQFVPPACPVTVLPNPALVPLPRHTPPAVVFPAPIPHWQAPPAMRALIAAVPLFLPLTQPGPNLTFFEPFCAPAHPPAPPGLQPCPEHVGTQVDLQARNAARVTAALFNWHERFIRDQLLNNGIFAVDVARWNGSADLAVLCSVTNRWKAVNVKLADRCRAVGNHKVMELRDLPPDTLVVAIIRESTVGAQLISYRFWVGLAEERGDHGAINVNMHLARQPNANPNRVAAFQGVNGGGTWCDDVPALIAAVRLWLPACETLTAARPFGCVTNRSLSDWQSMVHLHAACTAHNIPIDLSAFPVCDDRDCVINGQWCQVKAAKIDAAGRAPRYSFSLGRSCCGGPRGKSAQQPYTVGDPIAYFIFVAMDANGQLYGFRIMSRLTAIRNGLLADPLAQPPVVGRTRHNEHANFQRDHIRNVV